MIKFKYEFRPAKDIVRKLLVEACRQLTPIAPPASYQYVGFGGLEFLDFDMFRRSLGIVDMTSIEQDTYLQSRYEFNRPFGGIQLLAGAFGSRMTDVDWNRSTILWLDYEAPVNGSMLAELKFVAQEMKEGSVLFVTANAVSPKPESARRRQLVENVGEDRVPPGVTDDTLAQWGWARTQRDIVLALLDERLAARGDGTRFVQFFDAVYADDAFMQTFGGVISSKALLNAVELCRFEDLGFTRARGLDPLMVQVPLLTNKEARHLNEQLPLANGTLAAAGISDAELDNYANLYRWYPSK